MDFKSVIMKKNQSISRLALYIAGAVITSLLPDIESLGDTVSIKESIVMILKASLAGIVTTRAYLDQTLSKILR